MFGEFFIIKRIIWDLFKDKFKSSDLVLDIGCGKKPYYHKNIKAKVVCTDLQHTEKTHFVCDAMSLPLKKSKFDGVICVNSLYHYNDPFRAVKNISTVLKKKGKFILLTPFIYPIHDAPYDKYRFTEYGIIEILKNEFIVTEIKTIGGIFNIPAVFFHSVVKGLPLMVKKDLRKIIRFFSIIIFYPFYLLAQLISLLDFLDKSKRWPTYYFVTAIKK
jgi:SAM-dependent methyltransferase